MLGGQCNQESCAAGGREASWTHLVVRGAVLVAHGDSGCPASLRRVSERLEKMKGHKHLGSRRAEVSLFCASPQTQSQTMVNVYLFSHIMENHFGFSFATCHPDFFPSAGCRFHSPPRLGSSFWQASLFLSLSERQRAHICTYTNERQNAPLNAKKPGEPRSQEDFLFPIVRSLESQCGCFLALDDSAARCQALGGGKSTSLQQHGCRCSSLWTLVSWAQLHFCVCL